MKKLIDLLKEEDGQAVAEYAVLVVFVSLIAMVAFNQIGALIAERLVEVASAFN